MRRNGKDGGGGPGVLLGACVIVFGCAMEKRRRGESKADAQRIPGGGAPTPVLSGRCSPPPDRNHPIPDPLRSIAHDLSRSVPAKKRPFRRVVGGGVVLGSIQLGKSTRDTPRGTRPSLPFRNRGLKGIIGPVQPIPNGWGEGITQPARLEKIPVGRGGSDPTVENEDTGRKHDPSTVR